MKRLLDPFLCILILCAVAASVPMLVTGCRGTQASRVVYTSTETLGKTVDAACEAFTDYEVSVRAKSALGPGATLDETRQWVRQDPLFVQFAALRDRYNSAFNQWCTANALTVGHTNASAALADPGLRLKAIQLAGELTMFIAGIVGENKITVVRP